MGARRRLDTELVRRGLAPSRERAQADIAAGRVTVGGAPATKASRMVDASEAVLVHGPPPKFVSRAGAKLEGAVEHFALQDIVAGARVLDAGASTGGFTDCVLQYGASEVVAVDVGHNQLHEKLESDPRVHSIERTNLRTVDPAQLGPVVDLVVGDLSFISLSLVLDTLGAAAAPGAVYVLLVKPQFEAGRTEVSKGKGIIDNPLIWRRVLSEVSAALLERNAAIMGVMVSPITGSDGNVEFILLGRFAGSVDPIGGHCSLDRSSLDAAFDLVTGCLEVVALPGGED
ncbi:MAG: TlyA family RNA methyltransferase [Actinobacteria bacterium]|jgi:23S rRNA (cytidine1920-2'-O)/16S rRNA (cytidine1409-2'-O)-methyltransferase|nr:TlyA family RNA methyltransferase [Actinomycetota bacterium]